MYRSHRYHASLEGGQTVLFIVAVFVTLATLVTGLFATSGVTQIKISRDFINSQQAFFGAESGFEEVSERIFDGQKHSDSFTLNNNNTNIIIDPTPLDALGDRYVVSGVDGGAVRRSSFFINTPGNVEWNADVQAGYSGIEMDNSAMILGSVYSNGSIQRTSAGVSLIELRANPIKAYSGYVQIAKPRSGPDPEATHKPDLNTSVGGLNYGYVFPLPLGQIAAYNDEDPLSEMPSDITSPTITPLSWRRSNAQDNLAQQITVQYTGKPEKVRLLIKKVGTGGSNFKVKILGNKTGKWQTPPGVYLQAPDSANIIAESSLIDKDSITSTWRWWEIPFDTSSANYYTMYPGTPYWIVFDPSTGCGQASCANGYEVGASVASYQPQPLTETLWYEARYASSLQSTNWCKPPGCDSGALERDLIFELFVGTAKNSLKRIKVYRQQENGQSYLNTCPSEGTGPDIVYGKGNFVKVDFLESTTINVPVFYNESYFPGANCPSGNNSNWTNDVEPLPPPLTDAFITSMASTTNTDCSSGTCVPCHAGSDCEPCQDGIVCIAGGLPVKYNFNVTQIVSAGAEIHLPYDGSAKHTEITGDFNITNRDLIIGGNIYVHGNFTATAGSSVCTISIDTSDDVEKNLAIIVDGTVNINNCRVVGKLENNDQLSTKDKQPIENSHIMIISRSTNLQDQAPAILISNSGQGDMLYATKGLIKLDNSAEVTALYGEKIKLVNNTKITSLSEGPGKMLFPTVEAVPTPKGYQQVQ